MIIINLTSLNAVAYLNFERFFHFPTFLKVPKALHFLPTAAVSSTFVFILPHYKSTIGK